MPTEQCIVKELGNMNKATLIAKIAEKTGLNKKQAEAAAERVYRYRFSKRSRKAIRFS